MIQISHFVTGWSSSLFSHVDQPPWVVTSDATNLIKDAIRQLTSDFEIAGDIAVHPSATIEPGAIVKGPAILCSNSFVAAGAYLRGGVFVDRDCIVGPACELKTTFMFEKSKIAHLSFVGDSIVGAGANIEAGAIVANYRNELDDKRIKFIWKGRTIDTGVDRFGALIGDSSRIGANAVLAPGTVLEPRTIIPRLGNVDLYPGP